MDVTCNAMAHKTSNIFGGYIKRKLLPQLLLVRLCTDGTNIRAATAMFVRDVVDSEDAQLSRFMNAKSMNKDDQLVQMLLDYENPGPYINIPDSRFEASSYSVAGYASQVFGKTFEPGPALLSRFSLKELQQLRTQADAYAMKIASQTPHAKLEKDLTKEAAPIIVSFT